MNLAVGYIRVSTDLQDRSAAQQKADLLDWAIKNGFHIQHWYIDEGKSGTSFEKRPAFQQLAHDVEHHPDFSTVLCWDESRWSRTSPRESSYWKQHFARYGVTVRIIHTRSSGGNDFTDWLLEGIESEESGEYSRKLSRSTKRGQGDNAKLGYSSGGIAPFGYKRVAVDPKTGKFIRELPPGVRRRLHEEKVMFVLGDPTEVALVRRMYQLKVAGHGDRAIAAIFNIENIPCPRSGRWRSVNQRWSYGTVRAILKNPVYYGARVWNKFPQSHLRGLEKRAWLNPPEKWIVKENAHEAIISKELWQQANAGAKPYQRRNGHTQTSNFLLSGIMFCKRCGFRFHGVTKSVRSKNYRKGFYLDSAYHQKGLCESTLIRQDVIEAKVIQSIGRVVRADNFQRHVIRSVEERLKGRKATLSAKELRKKIAANRKAADGFFRLIEAGTAVEELRKRIETLEHEKRVLEDQLSAVTSTETLDTKTLGEKISILLDDFTNTFKKAPPYAQKDLIRRFVDRIIIDPDKRTATIMVKSVPDIDGLPKLPGSGSLKKSTFHLNGGNHVQSKNRRRSHS